MSISHIEEGGGGEEEPKAFLTVDVFQMRGLLCYINVSIIHWEPLYSRLLTHKMIIHLTSKMLMLKEIRHLHHKEENTCFAFTKVSFQKNELSRFCDLIILLRWFQWMEYNPHSSLAPTHACYVLFKDYPLSKKIMKALQ